MFLSRNNCRPTCSIFFILFQFIIQILISPDVCLGVITFEAVQNASNNSDLPSKTLTVYGGLAGASSSCTSVESVCDSCAGLTTLTPCNKTRIHRTLNLRITFKSDKAEGPPLIATSDSPFQKIDGFPINNVSTSTKNSSTTVFAAWNDICRRLSDDGTTFDQSCPETWDQNGKNGMTGTVRIGIDGNNDGKLDGDADDYADISFVVQKALGELVNGGTSYADDSGGTYTGVFQFEVRPGDQKISIKSIKGNGLPLLGDSNGSPFKAQAKSVRIYYYETSDTVENTAQYNNITPNTTYQDLKIEQSSGVVEVSPSSVTGLTNSTNQSPKGYYFKAAIVDTTGNVGLYTAPTGTSSFATDTDCSFTSNTTCHFGRPGAVVGVLSENVNCFIATAAWGSPFASKVSDFRKFRDRYMLQANWTRVLINWYYANSPAWAKKIADSPLLQLLTRTLLYPIWFFAWVAIEFGFAISLGLFVLISFAIGFGLKAMVLRRRAGA